MNLKQKRNITICLNFQPFLIVRVCVGGRGGSKKKMFLEMDLCQKKKKNQKTTHKNKQTENPTKSIFWQREGKKMLSDLVSTFLKRQQRAERKHCLEQCYHRTIVLLHPKVSCKDTALTPARLQANWLTVELLPSSPFITYSRTMLIN